MVMDEIKTALTTISEVSKNLEEIKQKLQSTVLSDENATIAKLNKELTDIINDLNELTINNAKELNNINNNNKWID